MRHHNALVVLIVLSVVGFAYAENTAQVRANAASDFNTAIDANARRNLKQVVEGDAAAEERGFPKFSLSSMKSWFGKSSTGVKGNPEIAKAVQNPKFKGAFSEVQKQAGFFERFKNSAFANKVTSLVKGKSGQLSKKNVETIGATVYRGSGSWKSKFSGAWVKYGAVFLLVVGLVFLATVVYNGVQPK
ncbi:hypothetical protein P3T76_006092 [Phytophthora citrophthora]|uniref:RxLR effector protein n=1 Tax=Phytophthora citrophthora TaxID=4793 RepID=A0AAD9LMG9_9STRA|nr:hypothetical protein P3T76_006092 [Phytophthora citrophthora]